MYRAVEVALGRAVAVKVLSSRLDPAARERFAREALAMSLLSDHPNVVAVYAVGVTASDQPYLVMPLVARGSVAALLDARGPLPWRETVRIGVRLAGALETAHRAGIVHRDVKPANILLSEYGEPLLTDFGIARVSGGFETTSAPVTASLAYAAPEVLDGRPPSVASDVYSLGSTLFALLVGRPPFEVSQDEALIALYLRIARDPIPDLRPRGVPDGVCRAIERATAKAPHDRPSSAADFGALLQDAQRAAGESVTEMAVAEPGASARTATASPVSGSAATLTRAAASSTGKHDPTRLRHWPVAAGVLAVSAIAAAIVIAVAALHGGSRGAAPATTSAPEFVDATPGGAPLSLRQTGMTVRVIAPAGKAAGVQIDGHAGERVTGRVHVSVRPARAVPVVLLAGASPLEEKSITDFDAVIEPVQLSAQATYVLRIGPSPAGLDATVELAIAPDDVLVDTTIGGVPLLVSLPERQQRAIVSFQGRPEQRIRASWTWSGPNPSYTSLSIAGPDGSILANWSALSTASSPAVTLAVAGRYSVEVSIDGDVTGAGYVQVVAT